MELKSIEVCLLLVFQKVSHKKKFQTIYNFNIFSFKYVMKVKHINFSNIGFKNSKII